jgi:hypothetical protein
MEKMEKRPGKQLPTYRAYLLRLWCEQGRGDDPAAAWRFSLEDAQTGARRGFADFETLVIFLSGLVEDVNRPE